MDFKKLNDTGFSMKQESGFKEADQISQAVLPESSLDKGVTAAGVKPSKPKVIPLRQEDIDLSNGDVKRKRFMIGIVVVLSIVLATIITRSIKTGSAVVNGPQTTDSSTEQAVGDLSAGPVWELPQKISFAVRDVTNSKSEKTEVPRPADLPQLSVRGIVVYNDDNKSAIVGDTVVRAGDSVKGVKVIMITADFVVFEKDGFRWSQNVE